jgi:hypothetical protein
MQRREADETLDHLHEVLDERFEAGPADYVIERAVAQQTGPETFAVEVLYVPTPGAAVHGLRLRELDGSDGGLMRTPLEAAWEFYRRLEDAPTGKDIDPDGVVWTAI